MRNFFARIKGISGSAKNAKKKERVPEYERRGRFACKPAQSPGAMKGGALSAFFARRAVFTPLFADSKSGLNPTTGTVGESLFTDSKSGFLSRGAERGLIRDVFLSPPKSRLLGGRAVFAPLFADSKSGKNRQPKRLPNLYLLMSKGTQNHPQVDLCGIRRAATLNGRSKIGPILPPVPDTLQPSGFFLRKDRGCVIFFARIKRIPALRKTRKKQK